jgi:metal-sulfur cluster biosynthetic enzyme
MPLSSEQVIEALREVKDPEVGYPIVDLGLIRDVHVTNDGKNVNVAMTLTSQMCPVGPEIVASVRMVASGIAGVEDANVQLVWDPPWDPRRDASEDVKAALGIWD